MVLVKLLLPLLTLAALASGPQDPPPDAVAPSASAERPAAAEPRTDWPMFRGDAGQTGIAAGSLGETFEVLWAAEVGGAVTSSPVVVDGLVYFGADDQLVHCVRLADGEEVWTYETEDLIEAPPMVHDGVVYCGSSDFFLYALDARTGELRWRYETDDKILGGATAIEGADGRTQIVFGSYDTHLYCLDAEKGELVWKYQTANYVNGTPAVWDRKAVFGGCDAILHVVDLSKGEAARQVELGREAHVAGSVAIADGVAYFGHYGNAFVAIDLGTGESRWVYPSREAFFSSPAITPDRLVFGGRDKRIHCVRRDTGEPLWTVKTRRRVDASPVACGDKVVVGTGYGNLIVLQLEDGAEVFKYELGSSIYSSPAVVDGRILVGAGDDRLYCFGPPASEGGDR